MISNEVFKIKIENYNPFSKDYKDFWKFIRRCIIEGYWQNGKYMPPQLFFYINLWHIKLNKKRQDGTYSPNKTIGKPFLRDIDWLRSWVYLAAKGFSGFELDDEFHCISETKKKLGVKIPENKKYVNPIDYLKRVHKKNLGKPLYQNQAYNLFDLEAREGGKSMWASAIIGHNYITDGILDYDEYLNSDTVYSSESIISAIDQKYCNDLASKVRLGLNFLEGSQTFNGKFYPSPISKVESGSLSKTLISKVDVQIKGVKKTIGSSSQIHNITFGLDEFAGAGKRPNLMVVDEVGFMFNLKTILSNMKDATYTSSDKFGVIWMTGTGGEMDSRSVSNIKDVFYNPENFDCLPFIDEWENKGNCGFFLPKWMVYNDFKDDEGNTRLEEAKLHWEKEYQKVLNSKDSTVINKFLINNPACPSHAFLTKEGNKFKTKLIEEQIVKIKTSDLKSIGTRGFMEEKNGKVVFLSEVDLNTRLYPVPFPYNKEKDDPKGCVIIYEHPRDIEPYKYISGLDPVAHDVGESLPSIHIYKRSTVNDIEGDKIVATYTGRGKNTKWHNEQSRLLLKYYNSTCMTENQINNVKEHFDNTNSLNLLAPTPIWMKSTVSRSRRYGINMTKDIRLELEDMLSQWLEEPNPQGGINLDYIYDLELLEELKVYDGIINTDRVDALLFTICYKVGLTKKKEEESIVSDFEKFFNKKFFTNDNSFISNFE